MKTSTLTISPARKETGAASETPRASSTRLVYRRILLAVDFGPASAAVFEHGLKLARENGSELLITHADVFPTALSFMPSANYDIWNEQCHADSKKQIERLVEKARKAGIRCHALALTGFPDDAIVHAAQKLKVDLIVIGAHGRSGVSRFFSGSVAARVLSHAPCSVLTVRLT